jgi:argininosuccinate synthase
MDRIVLAYSGALDTTVAIPWLAAKYHAEVVAVTADLGQGQDLEEVRDRALAAGAVRAHVLDAREEFARDFVLPALKADALSEDRYPLGAPLGRPLIARKLVEIAGIEQAAAIAHGGVGPNGGDHRLAVAVRALDPSARVLAPARDWGMTRASQIDYARAHALPVPAGAGSPYRTEANLWGRSIEWGGSGDPWSEPPEGVYTLTRAAAESPDEAAFVEITCERGVPIAVNGVAMPLVELMASLATIAGAHGVGRIDSVDNGRGALVSRQIYEAPVAIVLHAAHGALQRMVTTAKAVRFSSIVSMHYADLVDEGRWFSPLREALDAYVEAVQQRVTGVVRLRLFKGDCRVVGRKSPFALYDKGPAAYDLTAAAAPDR